MGTDIHLFVERGEAGDFRAFADGRIWLPRDYEMFDALAGVRGRLSPLIRARGIPDDVSVEVFDRYYERVLSPGDVERGRLDGVPPDIAAQWIERGVELLPPGSPKNATQETFVADPDAHHASYLTLEEVGRCLAHAGYDPKRVSAEMSVVFCAMKELARRRRCTTRVVFWFDN